MEQTVDTVKERESYNLKTIINNNKYKIKKIVSKAYKLGFTCYFLLFFKPLNLHKLLDINILNINKINEVGGEI